MAKYTQAQFHAESLYLPCKSFTFPPSTISNKKFAKAQEVLSKGRLICLAPASRTSFDIASEGGRVTFTLDESGFSQASATPFPPLSTSSNESTHIVGNDYFLIYSKGDSRLELVQSKKKGQSLAEVRKSSELLSTLITVEGDDIVRLVLGPRNDMLVVFCVDTIEVYTLFTGETGYVGIEPVAIQKSVEAAPLYAVFSTRIHGKIFVLLQHRLSSQQTCNVLIRSYVVKSDQLFKAAARKLTLPAEATSFAVSPLYEDKAIVGAADGQLCVCNLLRSGLPIRSTTIDIHRSGPPTAICWHPMGALVVVGTLGGEFYCFDDQLQPIWLALGGPIATPAPILQFADESRPVLAEWASKLEDVILSTVPATPGRATVESAAKSLMHDFLFIAFENSRIAAVRFRPAKLCHHDLVAARLARQQIREATEVVRGLIGVTSIDPREAYICCSMVANHCMRQPQPKSDHDDALTAMLAEFFPVFGNRPALTRSVEAGVLAAKPFVEPFLCIFQRTLVHLCRRGHIERAFSFASRTGSLNLLAELVQATPLKDDLVLVGALRSSLGTETVLPQGLPEAEGVTALAPEDEVALFANWRDLNIRDALRLGMWLESHGHLVEAEELYLYYGRPQEAARCKQIMQITGLSEVEQ